MNLTEYKEQVGRIPYGKRLPTALYVHREGLACIGGSLSEVLDRLVGRYQVSAEFNLVKFRTDELKLSFLAYPEFESDPHPALKHAITVDLATGKARHTDYAGNANPPILHRKHSFLPTGHRPRPQFEALTRAEEAAGLYEETTTIGFKLNWEKLLVAKGLVMSGHTLTSAGLQGSRFEVRGSTVSPRASSDPRRPTSSARQSASSASAVDPPAVIDRHKTALTRYDLSKPVKTLLEYGMLRAGTTLFDYGCGQGSDVRGLQALGHEAEGWDPVHRSEVTKREADVVNLGYVLNVIEDPGERVETLVDAYRHARRVLVVSALINETVEAGRAAQYGDGILTKRNTFQKYFEQQELQQYIEDALEVSAVPVALGVFYVFREPTEQQDFLSARSRRRLDWTQKSSRLGFGGPRTLWKALSNENKELLEAFGKLAVQLGRLAHAGTGSTRRRLPRAGGLSGISSQVRPSRSRPLRFLKTPPHCLK